MAERTQWALLYLPNRGTASFKKKNACVPPVTHRRKLSAQGAANDSVILHCLGVVITKQVIMFAVTS